MSVTVDRNPEVATFDNDTQEILDLGKAAGADKSPAHDAFVEAVTDERPHVLAGEETADEAEANINQRMQDEFLS